MKQFELNPQATYRLIAVTDRQGNDKSQSKALYQNRINGIATNFHYDEQPVYEGLYRLNMDFVENAFGQPCERGLHTSPVYEVVETTDGMAVYTHYSVYIFQEATVQEPVFQGEANLIELYLADDNEYYFEKGYLYDEYNVIHALKRYLHLSMFQDSVLLDVTGEANGENYVCRFFPRWGGIEFYDTRYHQQDYELPMLIHNTGTTKLTIRFQGLKAKWTIPPGESKRIIPYDKTGADEPNMNELIQALQPLSTEKE